MLPATALTMLMGGALGALLPFAMFRAIRLDLGVVGVLFGVAFGIAGFAGAYILGDKLNERVGRLRAPIGSASIGADGIRWRHFGKTEFIGWPVVRDIEHRGQVVAVHVDGREALLHVQRPGAFAAEARDALEQYRRGEPPETIAALELAGESVTEWLRRARVLLESASYREADVGEERCVRVATDPRAPLAQRIGSVAALSKASDDARSRVRVAIEETADPALANALEDVLEGRDAERALRSMLQAKR